MEELNAKEIINFFISKIYFIVIFIIIFAAAGYFYFAHIQTPRYHSSTTIILVSEKEDTNASNLNLNKQLVSTYSEIVKNRSVLNKVINKLDLNISAQKLAKDISVTSINDTEIIKIEVSNKNKKLARDIAEEVAITFISEINDIYNLQNVTILSQPQIENTPYNVSIVKQTALSGFTGLFISTIIVFLIYYFDTTIKSTEAIENKAKLTVLGTVEKVKINGNK